MARAPAKTPRTRTKPPQVPPADPTALHPGNGLDDFRMPMNSDDGSVVTIEPFEPPEETAADRVAVMMRNAGNVDRATVKLYKVLDPATKKLGSCRDYTPEEFEAGGVPMIRKHWGPGEYLAYLYGEVEGQYSRRGVMPLTILPDMSVADAGGVSNNNDALGRVLETIASGQQAMLAAITQRPDPTANLKDTLALMASMREAMGLGTPPPPPSLPQMLKDLRDMQKAATDLAKPQADKDDEPSWMKVLPGIVDALAARFGAGGGVPSPHDPSAAGFVPPVTLPPSLAQPPAVSLAAAPESSGEAVPASPPADAGGTAGAAGEATDDGTEMMQMYQALMFFYNGLAKRNADPEAAAITLYDQLPDEALPMLKGDDWWTQFTMFSPGSVPYRDWYTKVRDHILAMIAGETREDPAP